MTRLPTDATLIYDWNTAGNGYPHRDQPVELNDETLRDGLQSPSVRDPAIETKIELLRLMDRLGITSADLGLPGAGPRACADITALCRAIADSKLSIRPNCAVRTVKADITPLVEISMKVGFPIEAATFIGSSPIRQYAEDWTLDEMLRLTDEAVSYATSEGLPVMYVTEDTCRATPETIKRLYCTAIRAGARRICVCDTVGHITPRGVRNLVPYVRQMIKETGEDIKIDWHGHNDRGLGVINTITAMTSGVDRVHATALGIGERVGNCSMDQLLVNLRLMGYIENDLTALAEYVRVASEATEVPIAVNYPVFGRDAFRTATGVHAAAIIKARKKGEDWLADRVYSGVPAGMVGRRQSIEVGFMSGMSNVVYWLHEHDIAPDERLVEAIFTAAKERNRVLSDDELVEICKYEAATRGHDTPMDTLDTWKREVEEAP
ncbi:MAG: 2-isopropylmalate synthase [Acidobacteria bacterium]|nr:2-isopropylmalate synthase [Acidobacteriota bacterium]